MKSYRYTNITALFLMLAAFPACEKRELPDSGSRLNPGGVSTSQMRPNVSLAGGFSDTKAGDALGEPVNVYGSEDDGFTITEYVSDMNDLVPMTKGTEIIDDENSTLHLLNQNGQEFGVLGYFDVENPVTQPKNPDPIQQGLDFMGKSVRGSDSWGWSGTQQFITTFGANGVASSEMKSVTAPCWRVNTTEKIWSIYPATVSGRKPTTGSTGAYSDFADVIDGTAPSSFEFNYTVPTDFTAQQDLLFAYNVESKVGDTYWEKVNPNDTEEYTWVEGADDNFDVKFYHALAAVKFKLADEWSEKTTEGVPKPMPTTGKQYISEGTDVKKITITGIATNGSCTVTGTDGTGTRPVSFEWTPGSADQSVSHTYTYSKTNTTGDRLKSGYSLDGEGVLFMIPQELSSVTISVEFMKFGEDGTGHTVTRTRNIPDVKWVAGKYYTYELSGEIHVPGEPLYGGGTLGIAPLKGMSSFFKAGSVPVKGITKIGMIIDGYYTKNNNTNTKNSYIVGWDGSKSFSYSTLTASDPTSFTFNFATTNTTAGTISGTSYTPPANNATTVIEFGLSGSSDGSDETHYDKYKWDLPLTSGSGATIKLPYTGTIENANVTQYYVFDLSANGDADKTNDILTYNIWLATASTSSNGNLNLFVRGVWVLEVAGE